MSGEGASLVFSVPLNQLNLAAGEATLLSAIAMVEDSAGLRETSSATAYAQKKQPSIFNVVPPEKAAELLVAPGADEGTKDAHARATILGGNFGLAKVGVGAALGELGAAPNEQEADPEAVAQVAPQTPPPLSELYPEELQ